MSILFKQEVKNQIKRGNDAMSKSIHQIENEMKTVKLIKEALDVNGQIAHKLFKEWTKKDEDTVTENKSECTKECCKLITAHPNESIVNKQDAEKLLEAPKWLEECNVSKLEDIVIGITLNLDDDKQASEQIAKSYAKALKQINEALIKKLK